MTERADLGSEFFPFLILSPETGTLRTVHLDSLLLVAHLDLGRTERTRPVGGYPIDHWISRHRSRDDCFDNPSARLPEGVTLVCPTDEMPLEFVEVVAEVC